MLRCSGFVLFILLLPFFGKSQGITVNPSRLFFKNAVGQSASQTISLTNPGSEAVVFDASVKDWVRDSLGNKVYFEAGKLNSSNATWLQVLPAQISLQPGETKKITVYMQTPPNATPVTNSMLFLTQINPQKATNNIVDKGNRKVAIVIRLEIGIHIYNTFPSLIKKDLEFIAFETKGLNKQGQLQMQIGIKNEGELPTDAFLRFEIANIETGQEWKQEQKAISMLPGATQKVNIQMDERLPKGKYQAEAILDIGDGSEIKVARKEIIL